MAEQDDIRAMAQRFFDAIEAGDIETMRGSFTDDAEIWHNTDELIVTPAQTAQTLTGMVTRIKDREYADRRLTTFPGGFVQQHVLKGKRVHDEGEVLDDREPITEINTADLVGAEGQRWPVEPVAVHEVRGDVLSPGLENYQRDDRRMAAALPAEFDPQRVTD